MSYAGVSVAHDPDRDAEAPGEIEQLGDAGAEDMVAEKRIDLGEPCLAVPGRHRPSRPGEIGEKELLPELSMRELARPLGPTHRVFPVLERSESGLERFENAILVDDVPCSSERFVQMPRGVAASVRSLDRAEDHPTEVEQQCRRAAGERFVAAGRRRRWNA